jgi:hypothetical protein
VPYPGNKNKTAIGFMPIAALGTVDQMSFFTDKGG